MKYEEYERPSLCGGGQNQNELHLSSENLSAPPSQTGGFCVYCAGTKGVKTRAQFSNREKRRWTLRNVSDPICATCINWGSIAGSGCIHAKLLHQKARMFLMDIQSKRDLHAFALRLDEIKKQATITEDRRDFVLQHPRRGWALEFPVIIKALQCVKVCEDQLVLLLEKSYEARRQKANARIRPRRSSGSWWLKLADKFPSAVPSMQP